MRLSSRPGDIFFSTALTKNSLSSCRPRSSLPLQVSSLSTLQHSIAQPSAFSPLDLLLLPAAAADLSRSSGEGAMELAGVAAAADSPGAAAARPSRYESQKRRDWQTFGQYLRNHRPPLELGRCSGAHVLEFLRYLDQFGKTKVHAPGCPFFGHPSPPAPCPCPLRQAWGSLDALVGRLRAAFEEHGGMPEANPFGARAVRLYLREVRDSQAKARGIAYEKKRRKRHPPAHRQAKQQHDAAAAAPHHHHHHNHAAAHAAVAVTERRAPADVADQPAPHFLIPHAHFLHGHFLAPVTEPTNPASGVGAGDDLVMAMAAAAEAHAAASGFLMPLSVFH